MRRFIEMMAFSALTLILSITMFQIIWMLLKKLAAMD